MEPHLPTSESLAPEETAAPVLFPGGPAGEGGPAPAGPAPDGEAPKSASDGETPEAAAARPRRRLRRPAPSLLSRAAFLLGPWIAYLMVEILNSNNPFTSLSPEQVAFNLAWYYLIFWVLRMVLGRLEPAGSLAAGLCFLAGLSNHYVLLFRGRIIFPCDLLSLRTAANVAADYDYTPDRAVWPAAGLLAAYCLLLLIGRRIDRAPGRRRLRWRTVLVSWGAMAVFLFAFFATPLLPSVGIYVQQWKTQANGFLLNFMAALRYSIVSPPEGYSPGAAADIAARYGGEAGSGVRPANLIVIMNESFADLENAFPQLELTEDALPFFHSLTENTVKGTMIAPVTGGGTANVEFEFLTGDSLAFLPSSTVAYQLYCYDRMPSLVSQVKALGYGATAFHPYLASGWNRTSVYPWMGFDRQLYEEDVRDPELIRKYVSDSSDYQQLYRMTDAAEGDTFLFNVTMQNHSGYAQGWLNLERTVEAVGAPSSSAATQYFSLMHRSDDALRELIAHYQASDEPTMIVFFGDHQPPLGNDFYEKLYGKALDERTTEEVLRQYGVPFFIWANYDIPEEEGVILSSNLLGARAAQLAGLPLTGWQSLQLHLSRQLPVATTVGFVTADGTVTDDESALPEETRALYGDYRLMAYNHLFDQAHHPKNFYG